MSKSIMSQYAKQILLDFIKDLKENIFTESFEQMDLLFIEVYFSSKPDHELHKHLQKHLIPHEYKISERNLGFFLENDGIFAGLPKSKVDHYARVLSNKENTNRVSVDDMETIWKYMDILVAIGKEK